MGWQQEDFEPRGGAGCDNTHYQTRAQRPMCDARHHGRPFAARVAAAFLATSDQYGARVAAAFLATSDQYGARVAAAFAAILRRVS
jgi:hypothetical protein